MKFGFRNMKDKNILLFGETKQGIVMAKMKLFDCADGVRGHYCSYLEVRHPLNSK